MQLELYAMRDDHRSSSPVACAPMSRDSALQTTARGQRAASAFPTVLLKIHSKRVAGSKLQQPQVMCESFQLEIQRTCHCLMEKRNEFFVVCLILPRPWMRAGSMAAT